MLSSDDFRTVKTIADRRSVAEAAKALRINQSTVIRKLDRIEQRLGETLFNRDRSGYSLTARGEEMIRLAERMQQDTAFEQGARSEAASAPSFLTGVVAPEQVLARKGIEFLRDIVQGKLPQPPICGTLGFHLAEATEGYARFDGRPEFRHYNPIGSVHGGFAATLLDSAVGCAVHSTLAEGEAYTTLELKLNYVRPLTQQTGPVTAEGRMIHRGRTVATAEGSLKDKAGKLYAHATTTCMVFPARDLSGAARKA